MTRRRRFNSNHFSFGVVWALVCLRNTLWMYDALRQAMRLAACILLGLSLHAGARPHSTRKDKHDALGVIRLDGARQAVRWTDGDSFTFTEGERKGNGTRVMGYNALEAYGPVHQWGRWSPQELFELAKSSSGLAASREWDCTTKGQRDGYKRLLVRCPALALEMVRQGHGLAYAVEDEKADPLLLDAQRQAMAQGRGMWRKGVTYGVLTSVHSVGEDGTDDSTYNRVVDTRTGVAVKRFHGHRYGSCRTVCELTDGQSSCMVYVPFKHRYRGQPECLLEKH
jgi:endonuclease YncB( thermonuclease family)